MITHSIFSVRPAHADAKNALAILEGELRDYADALSKEIKTLQEAETKEQTLRGISPTGLEASHKGIDIDAQARADRHWAERRERRKDAN